MTWPQALRREALIDETPAKLSPMRHELLILLLLRSPGQLVTLDEIVEVLWPDPDLQPLGVMSCIHSHFMQLRRAGVPIEGQHGRGWQIPEYARGVPLKLAA